VRGLFEFVHVGLLDHGVEVVEVFLVQVDDAFLQRALLGHLGLFLSEFLDVFADLRFFVVRRI